MTAVLLALALAAPRDAPLTIGSPAPKLAPLAFVRGEPVKELARGTVYVVEFSGVECVPCIKCIPHLNALQKKHPAVVFLSVYGTDEKRVREFLAGPGKGIEIRVTSDPAGAMVKTWSDPACQEGIPHAFIVGADGKLAWIGNPANLTDQLDRIVAGTFDPQEDAIRLRVEQGPVLRARREEKGQAEYNQINKRLIAGELAAALADTDKALAEFRDAPAATELFRGMRVYLLANLPGRREEAFELATELAVDARASGRASRAVGTAANLLNAVERAAPAARDTRLIDLATALLTGADAGEIVGKEDAVFGHRLTVRQLLGFGYHLRGDPARATAAIREAIALVRDRKPPAGADEGAFKEQTVARLKGLEETLKEYAAKKPGR